MSSRSTRRRVWAGWARTAVGVACVAVVLAGCGSVVSGKAISMLYNPARVGVCR